MSGHALAHGCVQCSCSKQAADTNTLSTAWKLPGNSSVQHTRRRGAQHQRDSIPGPDSEDSEGDGSEAAHSGHSPLAIPSLSIGRQRSKQASFLGVVQRDSAPPPPPALPRDAFEAIVTHTAIAAVAAPEVHWKYSLQQEHLYFTCWMNTWSDSALVR